MSELLGGEKVTATDRVEAVRFLLDNGVGANSASVKPIEGATPLEEVLSTLSWNRWHCSDEEKDCEGLRKEDSKVASLLVSRGANMNIQVPDGGGRGDTYLTALGTAAQCGSVELAAIMIENGAKVNAVDDQGNTPLHIAVQEGHVGVVKVLLDKGAEVDAKEKGKYADGWTPLMWAVSSVAGSGTDTVQASAYTEIVQLLIEKGANVNAVNKKKETALTIAQDAQNMLKGIWQSLAPAQRANEFGQEYPVKINEYDKIINILKSAGAKASAGGKKASAKKRK